MRTVAAAASPDGDKGANAVDGSAGGGSVGGASAVGAMAWGQGAPLRPPSPPRPPPPLLTRCDGIHLSAESSFTYDSSSRYHKVQLRLFVDAQLLESNATLFHPVKRKLKQLQSLICVAAVVGCERSSRPGVLRSRGTTRSSPDTSCSEKMGLQLQGSK